MKLLKSFILIGFFTNLLFSGCNGILPKSDDELREEDKKKAIEIVQKAKVNFASDNKDFRYVNSTWLDYANDVVNNKQNSNFTWSSETTNLSETYLVCFTDENGWGSRWEVDVKQQTVKYINDSEFLSRKYHLTSVDGSNTFQVVNCFISKLNIDNNSGEINYIYEGQVKNNTDKIITEGKLSGAIKLIFEDKTIVKGNHELNYGFTEQISKSNPWNPNMSLPFKIVTENLGKIYLKYDPEYVVFQISLNVQDPVGFNYDKDIFEVDIKNEWNKIKNSNVKADNSEELENSDDQKHYIIKEKGVNARLWPNKNSSIIFQLNPGDNCVITKQGNLDTINNFEDYWYEIKFNGKIGWVFGLMVN
jgi:hypothetical protein